jgi:hypothetical protein
MKKTIVVLFAVLVFMQDILAQCPMCKHSVESNQATFGAKSVGMGLNGGILMLLGSVYLILFSVGIMWYKKYRKNQMTDNA